MIVPAHLVMALAKKDLQEDFVILHYRNAIIDKIRSYATVGETSMCFETHVLNDYSIDRFKTMFEAQGYTVVRDFGKLTFSWPKLNDI